MGVFNSVKGLAPGRSVFDLSWEKKFTCEFGQIIPVLHDNAIPGDIWEIGYECLVKTQPMAAPIMHPVYITVHTFFVPLAELCKVAVKEFSQTFDWEDFITGGAAGNDAQSLPVWDVTDNAVGSLWDYLCYPIGVDNANARPVAFKRWSYGWIWNEFFRDQNIDAPIDFTTNEAVLKARWEKDYFTSALPWQLRGVAPSMTITITGADRDITFHDEANAGPFKLQDIASGTMSARLGVEPSPAGGPNDARWTDPALSGAGVGIADLRLAASLQRYMELSARAGARYKEHLLAFFNQDAGDHRLDRPEYIGGAKDWLVTSEVLQTESSDATTAQGTMTGHGISVGSGFIGKYRVKEHGVIMSLFCIRAKTMYHQGIDRQDLQSTRYDFYNPMFAGLAEQEILKRELFCDGAHELAVFGYQGRYDEYRYRPNRVCGDMHATYDMWHLCRQFAAVPTLNSTFIEVDDREDWKADNTEAGFMVAFGNKLRVVRPMPFRANPGIGVL